MSSPSNTVVHEEIIPMMMFADIHQEIDRMTDILVLSYIWNKKQGIVKKPPSYDDVVLDLLVSYFLI